MLPLLGTGASIINQASIWGLIGMAGFSAYVASKHAVIGLTRSLAWELAPRGIRVKARARVASRRSAPPGFAPTSFARSSVSWVASRIFGAVTFFRNW